MPKNISRNMKIKATKYRNDYRVWLDYAGDYREVVYLAKIILEEMEGKDHGESS